MNLTNLPFFESDTTGPPGKAEEARPLRSDGAIAPPRLLRSLAFWKKTQAAGSAAHSGLSCALCEASDRVAQLQADYTAIRHNAHQTNDAQMTSSQMRKAHNRLSRMIDHATSEEGRLQQIARRIPERELSLWSGWRRSEADEVRATVQHLHQEVMCLLRDMRCTHVDLSGRLLDPT